MALPSNPLPPCPTRSCYRESRAFDRPPDTLFDDVVRCLRGLSGFTIGHAVEIERDAERLRLHTPFKVFLFTDDLDLRVAPHEGGAVLHVRSASRIGRRDLGTNRRRVRDLLDAVTDRTVAISTTA